MKGNSGAGRDSLKLQLFAWGWEAGEYKCKQGFVGQHGNTLTEVGYLCQPHMVNWLYQTRLMSPLIDPNDLTPNGILRLSIEALLQHKMAPSENALAKAAKVGQATIGRIRGGKGATLKVIGKIAKAYELEIWQLFVPGMNPRNPPALMPTSKAQRELYERLEKDFEELARLKKGD